MKLKLEIEVAARVFEVSAAAISRGGRVTLAQSAARSAVIWWAREELQASYPEIAASLKMNSASVRSRYLWANKQGSPRFRDQLELFCRALAKATETCKP